jgi:hypothetical protein
MIIIIYHIYYNIILQSYCVLRIPNTGTSEHHVFKDGTETSDNSAPSARVLHCAHGSLTHSILFDTGESASPLVMPRSTRCIASRI